MVASEIKTYPRQILDCEQCKLGQREPAAPYGVAPEDKTVWERRLERVSWCACTARTLCSEIVDTHTQVSLRNIMIPIVIRTLASTYTFRNGTHLMSIRIVASFLWFCLMVLCSRMRCIYAVLISEKMSYFYLKSLHQNY